MVKIYSAVNGKKHKLLHEGYTLHEVVADLYEWGTLDAWDDLAREDLDEQIDVLCDYVRTAHQDYIIEYEEDKQRAYMIDKSVHWKLVVEGLEDLSPADRLFALGKIAESIEVSEETEGGFTFVEDEE